MGGYGMFEKSACIPEGMTGKLIFARTILSAVRDYMSVSSFFATVREDRYHLLIDADPIFRSFTAWK
jgi:hypothetical protein